MAPTAIEERRSLGFFAYVRKIVRAIFHSFESWGKARADAMARPPAYGWLKLTAQSFDNFGRRELAIEESRATPGEAPLAQQDAPSI